MAGDDVLCYGEGRRYPDSDFVNFGHGLVHVNPKDQNFTPHYAANGKPVPSLHIPRVETAIRLLPGSSVPDPGDDAGVEEP